MTLRKFLKKIIDILVISVARMRVSNYERLLNQKGGLIVVSNHLGRLDAFLIFYLVPREDIIVMIAEKYQKYRFYRWVAQKLDLLFVDRYNSDFKTVREILRRLKNGGILVMAPEGTRSKTGGLLEGRHGAAFLASKAGVTLLPVGVIGSEDKLMKANLKKLKRTDVHVAIGEAFELPPLSRENRDESLGELTNEIMCQIAAILPDSYRGVYKESPRLKELLQKM